MDGGALTLHPNNRTLFLAPFVPGTSTQQWTYAADTGRLSVAGLCLSTTPVRTYVQVCGRIATYNGFNAATTPGYCFSVNAAGVWTLASNSAPIVSGNATQQPFVPAQPHRLQLSMAGPVIEASLDGAVVASVVDTAYTVGNAALGSGWHVAAFSNFTVTAPGMRHGVRAGVSGGSRPLRGTPA